MQRISSRRKVLQARTAHHHTRECLCSTLSAEISDMIYGLFSLNICMLLCTSFLFASHKWYSLMRLYLLFLRDSGGPTFAASTVAVSAAIQWKRDRESNGHKLITFLNRSIEKSTFNLVFCFVFSLLSSILAALFFGKLCKLAGDDGALVVIYGEWRDLWGGFWRFFRNALLGIVWNKSNKYQYRRRHIRASGALT